jgi:transcriptional accessory protein Tex/SPT6
LLQSRRRFPLPMGLLDEGATVPFIARYRKEVTGGLDDTQLRTLSRAPDLSARTGSPPRHSILESISGQGKLTDDLDRQDRRRHDQGRARRHLSALQAEAPHQGGNRA